MKICKKKMKSNEKRRKLVDSIAIFINKKVVLSTLKVSLVKKNHIFDRMWMRKTTNYERTTSGSDAKNIRITHVNIFGKRPLCCALKSRKTAIAIGQFSHLCMTKATLTKEINNNNNNINHMFAPFLLCFMTSHFILAMNRLDDFSSRVRWWWTAQKSPLVR